MPNFIGPYSYQPQPNPTTGGGAGGGADCAKLASIAAMSIAQGLGLGRGSWNGSCPFVEEFCRPQPCDGAALVPVPVTPLPTPTPVTNYANSNYGTPLPIVYGADKLKGNVIWAHSEPAYYTNSDTGEQGTYFLVHFALALCEGELVDILRMWSGPKLIFDNGSDVDVNGVVQADANGNLKSLQIDITDPAGPLGNAAISSKTTRFTVFRGTETQLPPPKMLEIEGACVTCAHRGVAYLFVENYISADGSVADFSVEVLANTDGVVPRSYFAVPTPKETFNDLVAQCLTFDPNYNTISVSAKDSADSTRDGLTLVNNTTFGQIRQISVKDNFTATSLTYSARKIFTLSTGHYAFGLGFGNAGAIAVVNAYTGLVNDIMGPGGGGLSTMASDGYAGMQDTGCSFYARGADGMPADILLTFSTFGGCYSFSQVNPLDNTISVLSFANGAFTNGYDLFPYPVQLTPQAHANHPTFADGVTSTYGTNIIVFESDANESTALKVWVLSYDNDHVNADPFNPVLTQIGTISLNNFYAEGVRVEVNRIAYDPSDNTFIIFAAGVNTGYTETQRAVKYNPFSGEVVWSVPIDWQDSSTSGWNPMEIIVNQRFAWGDWSSGRVYELNTADGTVNLLIRSVTAEGMPAFLALQGGQFYNGFENSLLYTSNTTGKELVKIYLGRQGRTAVAVSDVVVDLLQRVGVSDELIGVDDLTLLTLNGYTISNPTTLQACFSELATVFAFDVIESNGQIVYKGRGAASVATIPNADMSDVNENGWLSENFDPDFAAARKIAITYRDIGREYENNVQSFTLPKYTNLDFDADAPIEVTVPIVLDSATAKSLAEILLYSKVAYETGYEFKVPNRYAQLEPGDTVTLAMSNARNVVCRLRETSLGGDGSIQMRAVFEDPQIYTDQVDVFGITGRFTGSTITQLDPIIDIELLPIPYVYPTVLEDYEANYLYTLTAFNTVEGQTLAPRDFRVTVDGGDDFLVPATTSFPTWGTVITPLSPLVSYYSTDTDSQLVVKMLSSTGATLASAASLDALINNPYMNLACIGGELFQFQTVTANVDGTYTLSNFQRARYGTDGAVFGHVPGERFVLLADNTGTFDYDSFRTLTVPFGESPSKIIQAKMVSNNPFQRPLIRRAVAVNLRPWSVSALEATYDGSSNANFSWNYRSRYNGAWADDGAEALPFNDGAAEEYTLYLFTDFATFNFNDATTYLRKEVVSTASYQYTTAAQATDGFDNTADDLYILVYVSSSVTGQETGVMNAIRLQHL